MGHAVSSSDGAYRSLRLDTSIPGYDLESLRQVAAKALSINKFPELPLGIEIFGRSLLGVFINAEDWQTEPPHS
jgi:hypothetical protein